MLAPIAAAIAVPIVAGMPPSMTTLAGMFPETVIRKAEAKTEWPFSIDEGTLSCVQMGGTRHVFFAEILSDEEVGEIGNMTLPRMVVVSANPMAYLVTMEHRELYLPWDTLETLIKRLAPYERMGWALCDAPAPRSDNP